MKFSKHLLATAALMATMGAASAATTVNFTNVESPGVSCCGLIASNAYAAYGLTINDAYWYQDARDTFDQMGLSVFHPNGDNQDASIRINGGSVGISFEYFVVGGNRGVYSAYGFGNIFIGDLYVDASNGDVLGTHVFGGLVERLVFNGSAGFVQVSGITHNGVVPEPSTYALMALGLVGIGAIARRRKA